MVNQQKEPSENDEKEPIKVSFSLPQLIGGALAAATAAAVGSTLGVAGTIFGAAVASVVGGVGGTLYSAGIDRTHRKVASVITRTGPVPVEPAEGVDLTLVDVTAAAAPDAGSGPAMNSGDEPSGRKQRIWKVAAITAAAIFAMSLVVITVVELGLGRAFGGGDGTTVSQVVRPQAKPSKSVSPSPEPTPSTTGTSTPEPSPSESVTPTPSEPAESSLAPTPAAATSTATVAPAANTGAPAVEPTG